MKDLKNMTYDEFKEICDETDHFLGKKLNAEKKQQLDRLFSLCDALEKADNEIVCEKMPFTERSRNGLAVLHLPGIKFYDDKTIPQYLAKIFGLSDIFTTCVKNGNLILSFIILNMWDEWGRTDDEEHKGQYVGNLKIVK